MKCARPVALRASCSSVRPCFSQSPLSSLLHHAQSHVTSTSLAQSRLIQQCLDTKTRCFSSSPASSARNRFISRSPPPGTSSPIAHKPARPAVRKPRSQNVPTWQDYDPEIGIPLPSGALDQPTIHDIFGPHMDEEMGNHILRLMHYRRLSGSLIDVGVDFPPESGVSPDMANKALEYVRSQDPSFDENAAGIAWAESEIMKVEQEYTTRAENLGIYKRSEHDPAPEPQGTDYGRAIYGESALDALRRVNKARWMEEEQKKKEAKEKEEAERIAALKAQAKEDASSTKDTSKTDIKEEPGKIYSEFDEIALAQPTNKAWLQPVERKPWVKYYEEQAMIVKDNKVPNLSILQRLGPSALLVLALLAGCYLSDEMYTPPPRSARMFPDVPPAVATLGAITAINLAVFVAWRIPPLWRTMNKYFQVTAAYPFALGTFGAQFSHQSVRHLFTNLLLLWPFGWTLHDDVGRGTFLAVYLGCGALGSYGSLAYHVLKRNWTTYILGSSTAVLGTIAVACLVRAENSVKVAGYELPSVTGMTMLGAILGLDLLRAWRGRLNHIDYAGHFSSWTVGILAGLYIRYKASFKQISAQQMTHQEFDASNSAGTTS